MNDTPTPHSAKWITSLVPASLFFCATAQAVTLVINPSEIPTLISTGSYSTIPIAQMGTPLATTVPGLTVTLSGNGLEHRNDNFAAVGGNPGTISFTMDPACGIITGVTATHGQSITGRNNSDIVTFSGLGNAISLIDGTALNTNWSDNTTGTSTVGVVRRGGAPSPSTSGTPLEWEAQTPASSGAVTFESTGTGNSGFFFTIDYDPVDKSVIPEPSRAMLLALGGLGLLARRR